MQPRAAIPQRSGRLRTRGRSLQVRTVLLDHNRVDVCFSDRIDVLGIESILQIVNDRKLCASIRTVDHGTKYDCGSSCLRVGLTRPERGPINERVFYQSWAQVKIPGQDPRSRGRGPHQGAFSSGGLAIGALLGHRRRKPTQLNRKFIPGTGKPHIQSR